MLKRSHTLQYFCNRYQIFAHYPRSEGESYFLLYMRKQAPSNLGDLFISFDLDYLEPNDWIEIIRRAPYVDEKENPIHPVYMIETININRQEEYRLRTRVAPFLIHTQLLLYFSFSQAPTLVQEISFFVSTCTEFSYWTLEKGEIIRQFYYQFYQKYVQLFSYKPGYLLSTIKSLTTITINNATENTNGTFKAYWTAAPHLVSQEGTKYNVCVHNIRPSTECLFKQQYSKHAYTLYYFYKERSWNEADDFCKSQGGYLPIVRSSEEQDDIISIFNSYSFPLNPGSTFGMYLGLRNHKVCAFCN